METGHISQNTAKAIHLVSGSVEIISDDKYRRRKTVQFNDVMVAGDNDQDIRANFSYSKAFPWEKRKPIREMEAKGLVRLLDYTIGKQLGLKGIESPVPEPKDINEQYI